jgi:hypothetical protein
MNVHKIIGRVLTVKSIKFVGFHYLSLEVGPFKRTGKMYNKLDVVRTRHQPVHSCDRATHSRQKLERSGLNLTVRVIRLL